MPEFETITFEVENGVAWVTLNRPDKHNAFNTQMQEELHTVWRDARVDDTIGALVLTGAGDRAFCTGIDRTEAIGPSADSMRASRVGSRIHFDDPGEAIGPKTSDLWKPVVAAVNGIACGGAFYMLGEVDVVLASSTATFFDPHVTYGMVASFETVHMAQRIPLGELLRMQLLGAHERMSAQRAYEIGLVSEVCAPDALTARARWVAETIAARPRTAVQATVRAAWAAQELSRSQALSLANAYLALGTNPDDLAAGQRFFTEGGRVDYHVR